MAISDCFPDLWTDPVAWATDKGYDVDDATQAVEEASWLLWQLTGQSMASTYVGRRSLHRLRPGVPKFRLAHGSVDKVFSVKRIDPATNVVTEDTSWVDLRGGLVRIGSASSSGGFGRVIGSACGAADDTLLQVEYLTKPNLRAGADRVVRKLATEFYKSLQGGACALPERVTTISRQGLSWTVLDPMDFLDRSRTGIGAVDQWLAAVNLQGRMGLLDPLEWLELVDTEVIGCGESFVPA